MNKIRGEDKTIKSLLDQKFKIDSYQRDYKWGTKHVRELVEDLTNQFMIYYNPNHNREDVSHYGQYFLGSVIVSNKNGNSYIIDGQQRLTSVTLLLIYLDYLQKEFPDDQKVEIRKLVYSTKYGKKSFNLDIKERNECLQELASGNIPDSIGKSPSVQNLILRYNDIIEIFPQDLTEKVLPFFLDWLTEKVMLVEITAFSDDEAYTIFETMNDRGLSLTPTDMLKGYFFANIKEENDLDIVSNTWKSLTAKLLEIGKDEVTDCIKTWLRSQYADKIRERKAGAKPEDFDRLGTEFHRWVRENKKRVGLNSSNCFKLFVTKNFDFYARAYIQARRAAENYTDGLTSIYFNAQNNFTLQFPIMLSPLEIGDCENTVFKKMQLVAMFIEILLARRIWNFKPITHSAMQYNAFLIMRSIRKMDLDDLRSELIRRLSHEGEEPDNYFDFNTEEAFRLRGNNKTIHRILARLTEFLEVGSGLEPRYPEYTKRSTRGGGYQIEHLWANHPERFTDEFDRSEDFAAYRNRIGGLVLLPGPDNASLSDRTYSEKLDNYATQNLLAQSLHPIAYQNKPKFKKFINESGLSFRPMEDFGKIELDERQNLYVELAKLCWSPQNLNII
ncbi:MAG: DUF262 domain-containing protein [Rhodobacteraceae bacterium]|nr:DUF262 domain-containing protein [Paracoccaceae bacterium]MXZ50048.1 DUF262 domain-containing protein [Paracoccaceae bacterium]MYF46675.1 DUF262 domain-containing protein [Paracoccaceae bacterium]